VTRRDLVEGLQEALFIVAAIVVVVWVSWWLA